MVSASGLTTIPQMTRIIQMAAKILLDFEQSGLSACGESRPETMSPQHLIKGPGINVPVIGPIRTDLADQRGVGAVFYLFGNPSPVGGDGRSDKSIISPAACPKVSDRCQRHISQINIGHTVQYHRCFACNLYHRRTEANIVI